jgi:hypothetical protein
VTVTLFNHGALVSICLLSAPGKWSDTEVGSITFSLDTLPSNKQLDSWHALTGEGASGSMRIKINKIDEVILPAKEYSSLLTLLTNADLAVPSIIFEANRV